MKPNSKEKPIIYTFSPRDNCNAWRTHWLLTGFVPTVLPRDINPNLRKRLETSKYLERIAARPNAPSLDGYLRWIAVMLTAPDSQYVFMTQPNIFPGDIKHKSFLTEGIARYATGNCIVLLAGSDAVVGTKLAFIRMCELLVADGGVTKDNATDGFIVRRVQEQFPDFVIDIPSCKNRGEEGWETAPLVRNYAEAASPPHKCVFQEDSTVCTICGS